MRKEWWLGPGRYLLVSAALMVLFLQRLWTDAWQGDFWIYVAAVDEVRAHPFHPDHPLFGGARSFAFLSPYTWVLGILARITGLPAFEALILQGLVNLALLLTAIYAFAATWLRRPAAAFYAILLILFFWGADPWLFSSFFHFRSLALVLPYPSTLAAALALLTLAGYRWATDHGRPGLVALAVPIAAVLWIVHPVNALFLSLGLAASAIESRRPLPQWLFLAAALIAAFGLALLWPLYPVGQLFQQTGQVHRGNEAMYDNPLPRIAPALLGLPIVLLRLRRHRRDAISLLVLALAGLVVAGGLSGASTYGRLISHAVLLLQMTLADAMTRFEARLATFRLGLAFRPAFAAVAAALLIGFGWTNAVAPTLRESWRGDPAWLGFLGAQVGREDVVLTDLDDCWYVPAFGAKVVAYPMPLPFAPDQDERVEAVTRFFSADASPRERQSILERYRVSYLLLPLRAEAANAAPARDMRSLGRVVYTSPDYELRRLDAFRP
jgi:alpha-1,6-mannosyltransferase